MTKFPPPTVLLYLAQWAVTLVLALVVAADNATVVVTVIVLAIPLLWLWRGSRVAWMVLVALQVAVLIGAPFDPPPWWALLLNILALGLLLAAPTRRHVRH